MIGKFLLFSVLGKILLMNSEIRS